MSHRIIVSFKRIGKHKANRDEEVSLLWRLLREKGDEQHNGKEKNFCWNMDVSDDPSMYSMVFSSIDTSVTDCLMRESKRLMESGTGIEVVGGSIWTVASVMPVEDFPYIGETISLVSTTGMISIRNAWDYRKNKACRRTHFLHDEEGYIGWVRQARKRLCRRTNKFMGTDYTEDDIVFEKVKQLGVSAVNYKGRNAPVQNVRVKIRAPKEVLETALYGGLGSSTGSGFGMVTIC